MRAANTYGVDAALTVAVAVPVSMPFVASSTSDPTLLGLAFNAGTVVPLVWRRRAPMTVGLVVAAFAMLTSLHHRPGQMLQYGALVAIYTVADLGGRWQRNSFLWAIVATIPPAAFFLKNNTAAEFMFTLLLPLSAHLLGTVARTSRARSEALAERASQLERERAADAARAAAQERARIARDMHDVLAHAVSIMVVQAEAGPVVVRTDPDRAEQTFDAIAAAGRDAMVQLRRMLGVLKDQQDVGVRVPQPTLDALPELVATLDRTRLRVELHSTGVPRPVPVDVEVAAYRIVQEALTNTVKHASATSAVVRLDWTDAALVIAVTDDGQGAGRHAGADRDRAGERDSRRASQPPVALAGDLPAGLIPELSGGQGLIGIRERAAACGGRAEAGSGPHGGFTVTAWLPYAADDPAGAAGRPPLAVPAVAVSGAGLPAGGPESGVDAAGVRR